MGPGRWPSRGQGLAGGRSHPRAPGGRAGVGRAGTPLSITAPQPPARPPTGLRPWKGGGPPEDGEEGFREAAHRGLPPTPPACPCSPVTAGPTPSPEGRPLPSGGDRQLATPGGGGGRSSQAVAVRCRLATRGRGSEGHPDARGPRAAGCGGGRRWKRPTQHWTQELGVPSPGSRGRHSEPGGPHCGEGRGPGRGRPQARCFLVSHCMALRTGCPRSHWSQHKDGLGGIPRVRNPSEREAFPLPPPQVTAGKWRDGSSGHPPLALAPEATGSEPWRGGTAGVWGSLSAQSTPSLPPLRGGDFGRMQTFGIHI